MRGREGKRGKEGERERKDRRVDKRENERGRIEGVREDRQRGIGWCKLIYLQKRNPHSFSLHLALSLIGCFLLPNLYKENISKIAFYF